MKQVPCPCCHGEKSLPVFDAKYEQWLRFDCMHCQGEGTVPAEVDDET